ncbi:hypothetical protein BBJ28_00006385 [Nothophytophthora sp. Chile5]|nr:hypothetical protein BBJ28_00006385 [Nothophytophthora sp. Chile5]
MTPSGNRAFGGGQKRVGTDAFPLSPGANIAHSLGLMGDVDDFEMDMLSELLMQDDELPSSLDINDTAMSGSNDESGGSSSGDELSGSTSPSQETAKSKAKSAERKTAANGAASTKQTDRKAKRRAQVAVSARRHRYRKKHEMLDLKKEVTDLTAELHSLRAKHQLLRPDGTGVEAEEYTMEQRHKRRKAEKMNEQLRWALVMQRRFFASVRAVVSNSPIANAQLNMCSLMHTFTHLGRTSHSRCRDYVALCTDSKTDLAIQILLRETDSMDFTGPPSFSTQLVPTSTPQKQIVTTVAAYTFDTVDLKSVFISACGGILGCGTEWPHYTTVSQYGEITDKPQGNILYGVSDTHYQHTTATTAQTPIVSVESRSLFYYRMGGNYGVLVWDFADQDDLHPVKDDTTIKRDLVGAYVCFALLLGPA